MLAAARKQKPELLHSFGIAGVLLLAARRALGLSSLSSVAVVSDWDLLLRAAEQHGVLPFVLEILDQQKAFPSETLRLQWEQKRALQVSHFHWRKAQWIETQLLFDTLKIDFAPLKGAATCFQSELSPSRLMSDLDLLVKPSALAALTEALEKRGFRALNRPRFAFHHWLRNANLREGKIYGRYDYLKGDLTLDLHWAPHYGSDEIPLNFDSALAWARAQSRSAFEWELNHEDQFIFTLAHAHQGGMLYHWLDVMKLASRLEQKKEVRQLILTSPCLQADKDTRQTLANEFEQAVRLLYFPTADELDEGVKAWLELSHPLYTQDLLRPPTIQTWIENLQLELRSLPPLKRPLFLLGYFLPDLKYYSGRSPLKASLIFYSETARSLKRFFFRLLKAIFKK